MVIAEKLKKTISEVLAVLDIPNVSFVLEHPTDLSHGDYATNVAMVCSKQLGKNPTEVAEMIVAELTKNKLGEIEEISIAGPGFINIKLSDNFFASAIPEILTTDSDFGKLAVHKNKKVLVEHSSPNLFKPFHVGHMMNNAIGESLTRLMQYSGAIVVPNSFPSDVGLGIAKAIWAVLQQDHKMLYDPNVALVDKMKFLGESYAAGNRAYEDDPGVPFEIKKINEEIYQKSDTPAYRLYLHTKTLNMEYFETIVARLGSTFAAYIFESEAGDVGQGIVEKNLDVIFKKSEGAIVYTPEESTKLPMLVFITSEGHPTYETKDLGLLSLKFDRYQPDISAVVTDHQQIQHFDVVLDAAGKIHPEWKKNTVHVPHGRMSFKGQKMSSRLGGIPLATDILETVLEEVRERASGRSIDMQTEDAIAIAAIKFAILRVKPGQNINFDPETSLSFEGDSGPYLQYTHARIASMLEKAAHEGITPQYHKGVEEVSDLERIIYRLPEVVENAILDFAPQYMVTYLIEAARAFNSFYGEKKVIDAENKELSAHRLAIARSVQIVIRNGLWLLGIGAPNKM